MTYKLITVYTVRPEVGSAKETLDLAQAQKMAKGQGEWGSDAPISNQSYLDTGDGKVWPLLSNNFRENTFLPKIAAKDKLRQGIADKLTPEELLALKDI